MSTTSLKRKLIDIPEETFRSLSIMAAAEGKSLKSYIENLLISEAKIISDEDLYTTLLNAEPEGKIMASTIEQQAFEQWLEK